MDILLSNQNKINLYTKLQKIIGGKTYKEWEIKNLHLNGRLSDTGLGPSFPTYIRKLADKDYTNFQLYEKLNEILKDSDNDTMLVLQLGGGTERVDNKDNIVLQYTPNMAKPLIMQKKDFLGSAPRLIRDPYFSNTNHFIMIQIDPIIERDDVDCSVNLTHELAERLKKIPKFSTKKISEKIFRDEFPLARGTSVANDIIDLLINFQGKLILINGIGSACYKSIQNIIYHRHKNKMFTRYYSYVDVNRDAACGLEHLESDDYIDKLDIDSK